MRFVPLALLVVALAGCGGSGSSGGGDSAGGKEVFTSAGCGACHTLRATGSGGSAGPDLDQANVGSAADVAAVVRDGGREMPAFRDRLTEEEIQSVAAFVADAAGASQ